MAKSKRTGNSSRCCLETDLPLIWLYREDSGHAQSVEYELWLSGMTETARAIEEGEIEELFEAASYGRLEDTGDNFTPIKPITQNPEIYELRRRTGRKKSTTFLRFYHCEPAARPLYLVALHRHIKDSDQSQTFGLSQAQLRYVAGDRVDWN